MAGTLETVIGLKWIEAYETWDPGSILDGDKETFQMTGVTGAVLGDMVIASLNIDLQDLTISAYVQAADTVEVVLANNTGGSVNLGSGKLRVLIIGH